MNRRMAFLAASLMAFVVFTGALALAGLGEADPRQLPPKSTFSVDQARVFSGFPVYYAGDSVDGLPLVAVLRRVGSTDYVSFVYGTCVVTADTGCAPPAEVQIWPACRRHLALYDQSVPGTPVPEMTSVRGVPAAFFDGGQRLEIHSGRSLIVIFADSRERIGRIGDALRGLNVATPTETALPPPAAGAVEGQLRC